MDITYFQKVLRQYLFHPLYLKVQQNATLTTEKAFSNAKWAEEGKQINTVDTLPS